VNLHLEVLDKATLPAEHPSARTLVWLEDAPVSLAPSFLSEVQAVVKAGATLLLAGKNQPLLKSYASWTGGKPLSEAAVRPDILFEDFENGYDKWQVEGSAFGKAPARGTLPNQQVVSGFLGEALVNTYLDGDDTTGRLTSATFQIERRFIRFLIGGGHHAQTQIRLIVDGKVAHAASGKDNEKLESAFWDVSAFAGQSAHLEIVDNQKGPWGHINLDQIVFTDLPGPRELMVLLEQLLPVRFSGLHQAPGENSNSVELRDVVPQPGSNQMSLSDGRSCWVRQVGEGRVVLASGQVLDPKQSSVSQPRRRAYEVICALAGAKYRAGQGINPKAPGYGSLALVTTASNASVLPEFTDWNHAWKLFSARGEFDPVKDGHATGPTAPGQTTSGAVCATFKVPARESVEVPFVLAWCYPNKYNAHGQWMGCRYASQWPDVSALVRTARKQLPAWRSKTELFRKTMYETSLPYWITDCLTANAAIMRHIGVVFRIANGDVYGWEGSNGCCDPTCTHVWGYEQTLSRLFPDLEREMRRIDFKHQQRPDGGINNRTEVPSPAQPSGEQPFADGHASCILKAYREALNHTDEKFFQDYWPFVKRGVEYLIDRDARAGGGSPTGVLQDDQWNTYDEALHGVTTFISGYYLAALRAGEEWARRVGDSSAAGRFQEVFQQGQAKLVELCWNGEYFQQHLADYAQRRGEVGPGCMSDQLIGQWWAHQLGLGYILPREKVISALRAIYRYNFKTDLTHWKHSPRAFAGAGDKGLIICTWPRGGRPEEVMLYSDEVWTGIEYQAAAHFVYEGLLEEGLAVAKAARERYDGIPRPPIPRNPWNEIECGGHYARAMSSWSLLLALSGWQYDGPRGELAFIPRQSPERFKGFFCGPEGWGTVSQLRDRQSQSNELLVRDGKLKISKVSFQVPGPVSKVQVRCGGRTERHALHATDGVAHLALHETVMLNQAHSLSVRFDFLNR
jgi:uncharacterized protein (DUF608 family)